MSAHRLLNTDPAVRQAYSADVSGLVMIPDAVARPRTAAQVLEVLTSAAANDTPVTPAGSQTSTTGASIADRGILLSMRAMDRVIDIDVATRRAIVEPGVLLGDLNRVAAEHGLLFAPDPTSLDDVTVGGAVACNASGARSLLYGPTRPHVQALDVALMSGALLQVRRSGLDKNTAGYAFAQEPVDWFVGSEGSLGVITRAELSLVPLPPSVVGLAFPCADEATALSLVIAIRESPLRPRCIEYFDPVALDVALQRSGALVYVEDATGMPLDAWLELAERFGAAQDIEVFEGDAALREARRFRHAVPATMNERGAARRSAGGRKVSTDWAVPYRRLPEAIAHARRLVDAAGLDQPAIYGHAGNGHPHENFIAADADELHRVEQVVEETLRYVLSIGGTVSAEHGIGKIKRRWLPLQASLTQLGVMRAVKRELDPRDLLAPGNIL
ncbi:MAG TPA: FAD-binding oxidoreductase [Gemmatimonadaceae bacterium]|nr:FAD-binding oxidoreductase [Gemmatimonadaceae bacterium]